MAKKHKKKGGLLAIALTALLSCFFAGGTLARYTSAFTGSGSMRVAHFIFDAGDQTQFSSSTLLSPTNDKEQTYTFTVTNQKETSVSEVAQTYVVKISDLGNLPLTYTLKKGSESLTLNESNDTEPQALGTTGARHEYTLTVSWSSAELSANYAGEVELITVNVISTQQIPTLEE